MIFANVKDFLLEHNITFSKTSLSIFVRIELEIKSQIDVLILCHVNLLNIESCMECPVRIELTT